MIRGGIWPGGLMGQVMAVLVAAVFLEFLGSAILYEHFDAYSFREERAQHLAEQLIVADRLLSSAPDENRTFVANQLSSEHLVLKWGRAPITDQTNGSEFLKRWRQGMIDGEPHLAYVDMRLAIEAPDRTRINGTLKLDDGSFLHFSTVVIGRWEILYNSLFSLLFLIIGVSVTAALVIRVLGAPLRTLASAADAVGHGTPVIIAERGSRDLRIVARAFNAMQVRITDLLHSRTRALAAVSHDLRTPLSRLRLRSELIGDDFARLALSKDIDEMEKMLDSVLAYLAGDRDEEQPRLTDLASLAMTMADEAADTGHPVEYHGPDSLHIELRPLRVKRALGNLIENAVHYGARAIVRLHRDGEGVHLVVEDDGPGIAPEMLATVIEPFQRLDYARPRNTAGLGLGLSIVSRTMEQECGELRLSNRQPQGLCAELFFPH